MGNFFGEIAHRVGDLVSQPVKISKDIIKNPKKGLHELGDLYTHNEHKDQDLFQKGFGIKGWVGKHPQEAAAAAVATVFGGWAAWGAYGAGAAGSGSGSVAAGTAIGQTVPATPGMIAAANGGGAAIGTGANAASAAYAASSTPSLSILSGAGANGVSMNSGAYTAHLGGQANVGSASGTNPATTGNSWQDWARKYQNSDNQQQQSQPIAPIPRLRGLQSMQPLQPLQTDNSYQAPVQPQPTTIAGSNNFTPTFQNNF